jgi:hypothetical protein
MMNQENNPDPASSYYVPRPPPESPPTIANVIEEMRSQQTATTQAMTHLASLMQMLLTNFATTAGAAPPPATVQTPPAPLPNLGFPSALKLPTPPHFDGGSGHKRDDELKSWLFHIKATLQAAGVDLNSTRAVHYAVMVLTGPALLWWDDYCSRTDPVNRTPCTTFQAFEQAISSPSSLGVFDPSFDAREAIHKLSQTTSVHDYTAKFRAAIRHLPARDPMDHLHYYIRGLKPSVKSIVLTNQPSTLDEAIALAEQGDRVSYLVRRDDRAKVRFSPAATTATPMDLGNLNVAATTTSRPPYRSSNAKPRRSASPANRGRSPARTASTSRSSSPAARLSKLTDAERNDLFKKGGCYRCRQVTNPPHTARNCTAHVRSSKN